MIKLIGEIIQTRFGECGLQVNLRTLQKKLEYGQVQEAKEIVDKILEIIDNEREYLSR